MVLATYRCDDTWRSWGEPEPIEMPVMPTWKEIEHKSRINKLPKYVRLPNGQQIALR